MSDARPKVDRAGIAALLAMANAGEAIPPERHAPLVPAAAYVIGAGERIAAVGVDRLSPLADLWASAGDA